ncbi:helix-turn-helix domain-containing protein [Blautia schinkii]|nr:helix-turn-helix domain-containing protein [Blautia schinkii]
MGTVPRMLTIKEVSKQTGISYDFIRKLCLQGRIVHIRAGVKYLVNFDRFLEYLNEGEGQQDE